MTGDNCLALAFKHMWTEQTGPMYLGGEGLKSLTVQQISGRRLPFSYSLQIDVGRVPLILLRQFFSFWGGEGGPRFKSSCTYPPIGARIFPKIQ